MPHTAPSHIALIGLPGCGKSTLGRTLARNLKIPFVDVDAVFEQQIGTSIRTFFEQHGEDAFRDAETQLLSQILTSHPPSLIATGGGVILRPDNRHYLRQYSTVFYIKAQPEEIAQRLRHDTARPLMQGFDPAQRLRDLLKIRAPLYEETAHYTIASARKGSSHIARKIMMQIELGHILKMPTSRQE